MKKYPAVFRLCRQAPLEFMYYDPETQKLDNGMEIDCAMKYSEAFVYSWDVASSYTYAQIYDMFTKDDMILAIIIVNGSYLLSCTGQSCSLIDLQDGHFVSRYTNRVDYSYMHKHQYIPVGFERTYIRSLGAFVTPGRIYYDKEASSIYYKGKWENCKFVPTEFRRKSLYKQLLENDDCDGIVATLTGKGYKLLK